MASENDEIFEVVVIGAGVIGSATAYYLAKEFGNKALLVEQFDFLHRRGSSHGDSRIIRYTYSLEQYAYLMKHTYPLWKSAETEAGTKVYRKTGGIDIGRKDNENLQSIIAAAEKWEIPIEILNPDELTKKFPRVTLPSDYIGIYNEDSGVLNATKAVSMFQNLAKQNGCRLMDNVKIVGVKVKKWNGGGENLFEIETKTEEPSISDGEVNNGKIIRAKKCVITGGPWTQKIVDSVTLVEDEKEEGKSLNLKLPLNPIQTTVAYYSVDRPEEFSGRTGKFPVFINHEGTNFYGGPAIEYPSLMKCGLHGGFSCDPDKRNFLPATERMEKEVGPFLTNVFTGVDQKPTRTESCMYTETPDENFILDHVPGVNGLVMGCGFSGHGFKLAPMVGQILTGLVVNGESPFPSVQHHFQLTRFSESP